MTREIRMNCNALINADGTVTAPSCCNKKMRRNGGCSMGCCDDYKCDLCEREVRVEWPD